MAATRIGSGKPSGPPPKPTAIRVLHGDKKNRINADEPKPRGGVKPPAYLSNNARAIWDDIAPDMERAGVLTSWDVPAFAELCEAFVICRASRVRTMREVTGQLDYTKGQLSATTQWLKAISVISNLSGRFGMTPSDRSRLQNYEPGASSTSTRGEDLLSG